MKAFEAALLLQSVLGAPVQPRLRVDGNESTSARTAGFQPPAHNGSRLFAGGRFASFKFAGEVPRTISLRNQGGAYCLDNPGGGAVNPGSQLDLWECNGHTNQLFLFDAGAWKIQLASNPNMCLDAGDMHMGTQVFLWECNGQVQQQWGYDYDEGTIYLSASESDASLCLDAYAPISGGNSLQVWSCNGLPQQQFDVNWGTTIRVAWSYKTCLDLYGGDTTPGNLVQVWPCNGLPNQQWIFDPSSGALVYGGNGGDPSADPRCIDAHDWTVGNRLIIWYCNGLSQQKWGFDNAMQTLYLQDYSDSTRCMDLYGGELAKGIPVQSWECNGCWNQQWLVGGWVATVAASGGALANSVAKLELGARGSGQGNVSWDRAKEVGRPLTCPVKPLPPAPKPAPGRCLASDSGSWPEFQSSAEMAGTPWGAYFEAIYGSIPDGDGVYPFCVGEFWMFYTTVLQSRGVTDIPQSVGKCPTKEGKVDGQFYEENNKLSPAHVAWSWHPIPYSGLSGRVEVIHEADTSTGWQDENNGAWFFYAKGSGIWVDVGNTIVFQDHGDGYKYFGATGKDANDDMAKKALAKGYDSIQFLSHTDSGDYGDCRKNPGTPYFNIEILMTKMYGEAACASRDGNSPLLMTGWVGSKGTCSCDNKQTFLNCAGVPSGNAQEMTTMAKLDR